MTILFWTLGTTLIPFLDVTNSLFKVDEDLSVLAYAIPHTTTISRARMTKDHGIVESEYRIAKEISKASYSGPLSNKARREDICRKARRRARQRSNKALNAKNGASFVDLSVKIDKLQNSKGDLTGNREEWREIIHDYGTKKDSCPDNTIPKQLERLKDFHEGTLDEPDIRMTNFEILQALADRSNDKGIKRGDSSAAEVYKWFNLDTKLRIGDHFRRYANDLSMQSSKKWRTVQSFPLKKEKLPRTGKDFRWIGKSEEMQKWYLGTLMHHLDLLADGVVLSFGFRRGAMVEDVVAIIRELVHSFEVWGAARAWNGSMLVVGSQDVETAFDQVNHEMEAVALIESWVPLKVAAALFKENVGVEVVYDLPKVGFTEPVPSGQRLHSRQN